MKQSPLQKTASLLCAGGVFRQKLTWGSNKASLIQRPDLRWWRVRNWRLEARGRTADRNGVDRGRLPSYPSLSSYAIFVACSQGRVDMIEADTDVKGAD